jgi:hypothetical protein
LSNAPSTQNTAPVKAGAVFRRSLISVGGPVRRLRDDLANAQTAAPADLRRAVPRPSERVLLRISGWAMIIFSILVVGLVLQLALLSPLAENRSQTLLYNQFRGELAGGTAPVGQVDNDGRILAIGAPVALVSVPALGIDDAVVEGTTSRALMNGPGHRRDTPLPGQAGVSVIYGRQAAYGGPFADISQLRPGDPITTTTGQGQATYKVIDVRYAGDLAPALPAGGSRLTLVSAKGVAYLSGAVVRVDADLVGKPFPAPQPVLRPGSLAPTEDPMGTDTSGWMALVLLLELAAVVGVGIVFALRRWGTWHTWIVGVPVLLAVGVAISTHIVVALPNLY